MIDGEGENYRLAWIGTLKGAASTCTATNNAPRECLHNILA